MSDFIDVIQKEKNKIISASDFFDDRYVPEKAFDTSNGTLWHTYQKKSWIQIKFDRKIRIKRYMIIAGSNDEGPMPFEIQGSNDGINFESLDYHDDIVWIKNREYIFELDTPTIGYYYYRLYSYGIPSGRAICLSRFALEECVYKLNLNIDLINCLNNYVYTSNIYFNISYNEEYNGQFYIASKDSYNSPISILTTENNIKIEYKNMPEDGNVFIYLIDLETNEIIGLNKIYIKKEKIYRLKTERTFNKIEYGYKNKGVTQENKIKKII